MKYYCWRSVETGEGWQDQYLDGGGNVADIDDRCFFATREDAQDFCERHHEIGEAEFVVQGG